MKERFIEFWHKYSPGKQFHNRYPACQRLWDEMDERKCHLIMEELETVHPRKNPYFYLVDWKPPQPQWLSPKEVGHLLGQHIPLAVCRNPQTQCFGTVTREEAERHGLEVHHYM